VLEFRFEEFIEEGKLFLDLAEGQLTRGQREKVAGALSQLESYRYDGKSNPHVFLVEDLETYQTPVSVGHGAGAETVYLAITMVWPIEKVYTYPTERFILAGEALTNVDLFRYQDDTLLRSWAARLSASRPSPTKALNCVLSSTFDGYQGNGMGYDVPVNDHIDIPYIPTLPVSPFAAAEFAIAELWPFEWKKLTGGGPTAQAWRLIQRRRLDIYLTWLATQARVSPISPWMAIRDSRPPGTIFI
jgi:hypothetical protein